MVFDKEIQPRFIRDCYWQSIPIQRLFIKPIHNVLTYKYEKKKFDLTNRIDEIIHRAPFVPAHHNYWRCMLGFDNRIPLRFMSNFLNRIHYPTPWAVYVLLKHIYIVLRLYLVHLAHSNLWHVLTKIRGCQLTIGLQLNICLEFCLF